MSPEQLIGFRNRFNLNQSECAKALYVSPRSISNWENGKPIPKMIPYLMSVYAMDIPGYSEFVIKEKVRI